MQSLGASGYRINGNLNEGVGDAGIGTPTAGTFPVENGAYGQLGKNLFLDTDDLVNYTNPSGTIATLYGGWFKYVHFKSSWSATLAAGQPLFYADAAAVLANEVTADAAATSIFAGIALSPSTTKGNYWWIQTSGVVYVKCKATVSDTTAGNLAVLTDLSTATIDGIADATDYGTNAGKLKAIVGKFLDAPANGALKRILLTQVPLFQ